MRTSSKPKPATEATYLERVNLAIDHIAEHLDRPLTLTRLARVAMLSPFHFHRVFQSIVGQTPADYVKRLRLDRALTLMAYGRRRSLTVIAGECGFASSSDFSRSFKHRFGVSPRSFDLDAWRASHGADLNESVRRAPDPAHIARLPAPKNPDAFRVRIRDLPARRVAYIRVARPYQGTGVVAAAHRLMAWADRHGLADGQWLGYQRENPELVALSDCQYYVGLEAATFTPRGEIGSVRFPPMVVAQVEIRGPIELELRALFWLYGTWLPRSGYVPDDQPAFEAWIGRPFAHGFEHFEVNIQIPIRRLGPRSRH